MRDHPPKDHSPSPRPARRPARTKLAPLSGQKRKATAATPTTGEAAAGAPQRIAKVIARAGACSRRDAEAWIGEGRVALNGVVLETPAVNVGDGDEITIDGAPLAARARTRLFLFHKPRGLVTTERDPEGRQTIFDYLRAERPDAPRLVSVGRLDINTEGLILLTNDGGLARVLELPATGWVRRYRVRANGKTDQAALDQLRHGVTVEGVAYAEIEAKLDRVQGANCWLTMGLREGKNREVKRVLEHLGLEVNRLIRLSFGPFQLGELAEGAIEEVKTRVLRDQLGPVLAEAAGVDFSGPAGDLEAAAPANAPPRREAARQVRASSTGEDVSVRRPSAPRPAGLRAVRAPERQPATPAVRQKPAPGPRKHISALREDAEAGGPRKRTLRSATADRAGRSVPVERLVAVERPAAGKGAGARRETREEPTSRNGRRFEAERKTRNGDGERPRRGAGREDSTSAPRASERRGRGAEGAPARAEKPWGGKPARASAGRPGRNEAASAPRAPERRWRDAEGAPAPGRGPGREDRTSAPRVSDRRDRAAEGGSARAEKPWGGKAGRGSESRQGRGDASSAKSKTSGGKTFSGKSGGKAERKTSGRAERPRGPYDAAKDRSRPDARGGPDASAKRFDKRPRASEGRSEARSDGPRGSRFDARPEKARDAKFAGPRGAKSGQRPSSAGPASGFRGAAKRPGGGGRGPGGKAKPGAGPRRGPGDGRGRPDKS